MKALDVHGEDLVKVRGFVVKENYPQPLDLEPLLKDQPGATFICHCDDVTLDDVLKVVGDRTFISIDEIKHTTRLGMDLAGGNVVFLG